MLTATAILLPGLAALLWNGARRSPGAGPVRIAWQCLCDLPEFVLITLYGFFVGPVVSGATAVACLTTSVSKGSWIPPGRDGAGYRFLAAVLDLAPIWLFGMIVFLVAATQPADMRPFLLVLGVPLLIAPGTACVVSSPALLRRLQRMGLFNGVEADAARSCSAEPCVRAASA